MAARRQALRLAARALEQRLNADRSDQSWISENSAVKKSQLWGLSRRPPKISSGKFRRRAGMGIAGSIWRERTRFAICPDFELRSKPCKHIFAVAYTVVSEQNPDGSTTVTETVVVIATKRKTYPQNWKAYNPAQTNEQDKFQALLGDLCKLPSPQHKNGRPPLPLSDAVFNIVYKTYSTISQRRFMPDLREAHGRGTSANCRTSTASLTSGVTQNRPCKVTSKPAMEN